MDCIVHGVAKSQTQLSNFHVHIYTIYANMYIDMHVYACTDTYMQVVIIQYFSVNFTQTEKSMLIVTI